MSLEFSQELDTPIISPTFVPQDAGEIGLRPKLLNDYTGQEKAKGNLAIYIEAARRRNFMGLVCEQHRYDMLRRAAELEAFPACIDQGIGITLFSPLQRGLLGYDILEPDRPLPKESMASLEKYRPQLTE